MSIRHQLIKPVFFVFAAAILLSACAPASAPDARNVSIPAPANAAERRKAVNERPDSVMFLPLGEDVLIPEIMNDEPLPTESVGPFELRGETLAGALQLILADYDVSLAFETDAAFSRYVTVSNLHGDLDKVVRRVCSLANLYCSYEEGTLIVKDQQTFSVTIPPVGDTTSTTGTLDTTTFMTNVSTGLAAVLGAGSAPIVDSSTRTIIYTATQRTAELASRYFQRLRANTAMIVFETYIWEVNLNAANSTGINWDAMDSFGKYNVSLGIAGNVASNFTNPVSIGLPTTQTIGATPTDIVKFLSQYGAVKSISQPQITVLSGSTAQLRVAETENYVSEISTTFTDNQSTTAVDTDSVDSGFTLTIASSWDKSTVYAHVAINLTNVLEIENFAFSDGGEGGTSTSIQLPQTTERELSTQIRMRPGDSILIAGLVQESDNLDSRGPGLMEPIVPDTRTAQTDNLELVFLLRPRVVVYTTPSEQSYRDSIAKKSEASANAAGFSEPEKYAPAPRSNRLSADPSYSPSGSDPVESVSSGELSNNIDMPAPAPEPMPIAPAPQAAAVSAPVPVTPVETPMKPAPTPAPVPVAPVPAPTPTPTPTPTPAPAAPAKSSSGDSYKPSFGTTPRTSTYSGRASRTSSYQDDAIAPPPSDDALVPATPSAPQAPYDNSHYSSGYVSKYLDKGASASSPSSYEDAESPQEPASDAVEIYDLEGAPDSGSTSGYSTYGSGY